MAYYKLYFVEAGRFGRSDEFQAEDDEQAIREAAQRAQDKTAELWSGGRKVKIFNAGS